MDEWNLDGIYLIICSSPSSLQPGPSSGGWWLQNRRIGSGIGWDVELLGVSFVDFGIEEGCIEIQLCAVWLINHFLF